MFLLALGGSDSMFLTSGESDSMFLVMDVIQCF